jgi:NAD(P)H-hydrate epimerase
MKKLSKNNVKNLLRERKSDAHKGNFGHVLVVAGSRNFSGAAVLCAGGCARSGCGLVTAAFPENAEFQIVSRLKPEIMTLPLDCGINGVLPGEAEKILDFIIQRKVTAVAVGCGLGTGSGTASFIKNLLKKIRVPVVVDADALNISAQTPEILSSPGGAIITPHPAEFARLSGLTVKQVQQNRENAAMKFAARYNVVCVLKGAGTVITDGNELFVNTTGNPGMAAGGSGDVLTGMIAAFTGQASGLLEAACLGAYLHGLAGDRAADEKTQVSMLPGDIVENIPAAIKLLIGLQKF